MLLQRTLFQIGITVAAIAAQQLPGTLSQHATDFTSFALDSRDRHGLISGRLVSHPGNHGGFGSLLHGDRFGLATVPLPTGVA